MIFPELHRHEVNSMKASMAFFQGLYRRVFKHDRDKVFIIGFHKTGTSSLGKALQILGYRVCGSIKEAYDYDTALDVKSYILKKAKPLLSSYDAFQDTPWFLLYQELYKLYPEAKFILTKRHPEQWAKSVQNHFGIQKIKYHDFIYGTNNSLKDESIYLNVYNAHNTNVQDFFSNKGNFLVFDPITDGWEELANFLNVKKPNQKFPYVNKSEDRNKLMVKIKKELKRIYYK
ncbi:sulfotransferase family protein [Pseudotamlana agarivorans]|uniref:sulfotransferase family protein n=1 Tax=Pseudotamlana agarivorans TaxID=481183 RepID=UPI0009FD9B9E|nr:sulfotransferase family protein [Tamlana agarivorans]